jgi:sugar O-acyltransferase (sialic acid O-acetyltransferase NeuD family)
MKDLVIIGAGGLGKEVAWLVERMNQKSEDVKWNLLGFIDDNPTLKNKEINGYVVLGNCDYLINNLPDVEVVCAIASPKIRKSIIDKIDKRVFPCLIDPSVLRSNYVKISQGCIICADVLMTVNVEVAEFTIIDRKCNIGHDSVIEEFSTLYPNVVLSGHTTIKTFVELGTNSCVIQGLTVGSNTIIGAGATVVKDIPNDCIAVGTPAIPINLNN